jgi:hypothetical protein
MKPPSVINLVEPVSIRIGALLRLIRELNGKKVLDILEEYNNGVDRYNSKQISTATWSTYETGSRIVGELSLMDVNQMVLELLKKTILDAKDEYQELFEKYKYKNFPKKVNEDFLNTLYYKERLILSVNEFFPLRYIGAAVLANYLFDMNESVGKKIYPEDINKYLLTNKTAAKILFSWLRHMRKDFRNLFAKWLIFENRFISRFNIDPSYSILRADKYFSSNRIKGYKGYDNLFQFYSDFAGSGLFFEHLGPAIDAILALSKKFELSNNFNKITITVENIAGVDKTIEVYAYWTEIFD